MPSKGSWDVVEAAMENQSGGTYLRLENDGDKAVVAFCGAPFHTETCYNESTKTYEAWSDAQKAAGRKRQSRYAQNVYVLSLKGKPLNEMRVVELNFNTMTAVIGLRDKFGFSKFFFEIKRHGAAGDTKTTYQVLPENRDITAEDIALFGRVDPADRNNWIEGTVPLIDLETATSRDGGGGSDTAVTDDVKGGKDKKSKDAAKPAANGAPSHAAAPPAAPAPAQPAAPPPAAAPPAAAAPANANGVAVPLISKESVAVIIELLKPLDRDKGLTPFLAKFPYIRKVSEVRASDEAAAVAYAKQLANPAPPAAEDPFA